MVCFCRLLSRIPVGFDNASRVKSHQTFTACNSAEEILLPSLRVKSHRQSKNNGISGRADALEAISVICMLMLVAGTHMRFIKRVFSRKKGNCFHLLGLIIRKRTRRNLQIFFVSIAKVQADQSDFFLQFKGHPVMSALYLC